ncbi:hypothetical protein Q5H92_19865 [Hymenobacter sp. M29]|uniref:Lipocalin-like domain-containing protein n=1 Tax=Hymenobacter mellowenesis TaxID=3063995 RepID=A0ABT9AFI6_9BACT|nr:hypothetical protein [Hymenobacter sp. M29]MDO7848633.1 hypothetical protein [Hymenobacter sp. M29]
MTTSVQPVTPGSITVTYGTNGSYQSAFNGVVQSTGTYSVSGTLLTVTTSASLTSTITELTASRLEITTGMEDSANRYEYIDAYTR